MSDERFITFCYNLEAEERKRHFDETPAIPQNIILEKVNTCHEVESLKRKPIFFNQLLTNGKEKPNKDKDVKSCKKSP